MRIWMTLGAASALVAGVPAAAATLVVDSQSQAFSCGCGSFGTQVAQFSAGLGALNSVTVEVSGTTSGGGTWSSYNDDWTRAESWVANAAYAVVSPSYASIGTALYALAPTSITGGFQTEGFGLSSPTLRFTSSFSLRPADFASVIGDDMVWAGTSIGSVSFTVSGANDHYQYAHYDTASITSFRFIYDYSSAVPEPVSWALLIAGFGLVGNAMRRRSRGVAAPA